MKPVFATLIFAVGTILAVTTLVSGKVSDSGTAWGIAAWSSCLVVANWVVPGILIKRSGKRNPQMGVMPAVAVSIFLGSFISLFTLALVVLYWGYGLVSTLNLVLQVIIFGATGTVVSMFFVSAAAAEIGGGPLKTEDRENLLSGLERLRGHVQAQYPELVDSVRELDSGIRSRAPHPSRIERVSDYRELIALAIDDSLLERDETQLRCAIEAMQKMARTLR
ncbi:hypothetical protein OAG62_00035 [bacterium]|nr:hypothetical protein [bacterium]